MKELTIKASILVITSAIISILLVVYFLPRFIGSVVLYCDQNPDGCIGFQK